MSYDEALAAFSGSPRALARALDISIQAVYQWKLNGVIPPLRVYQIKALLRTRKRIAKKVQKAPLDRVLGSDPLPDRLVNRPGDHEPVDDDGVPLALTPEPADHLLDKLQAPGAAGPE